MTELKLTSKAELKAEKAENLKPFSGIKLLHIKKQISTILSQIGANGIFDEYTKHDITHIDHMLASLDWIIPEETKEIMSHSDWLMITLAIYFHDLGMLVTKDEFNARNKSEFPNFKNKIFSGEFGADFRDKIAAINSENDQDRFIYQELVRKTHAERIKYWILNEYDPVFGNGLQVQKEIQSLLSNLDPLFKKDLAIICESHNLGDLEDFEKYKVDQQYGPSNDETVNLHYSALLLRTSDLLHMTSDRTPSIEYRLINPTDPLSQEEWAKQNAVKAVRPQSKKNKENIVDHNIPKDSFEVIALFESEKGFFGLVSYLNYVNKELKENYKVNEISKKTLGTSYEYPWRSIDDSKIQTQDFDKRQFEFVLDQTRILDLLVGHTLYNDSTVVLRELTQNSIDATKLKKYENESIGIKTYEPEISINWKSKNRELEFIDNGTGMNLDIIENHLLKVGSSRYQDDSFKKNHPDFSPISRFGIGLLTCFLIADDLDILTKMSDGERGILLKIKKVHGKYLLKYLSVDKLPSSIKKHGTIIKLYVRSNVDLGNIEKELRKWIILPNTPILLDCDGVKSHIGYSSVSEVLSVNLKENGYTIDDSTIKIKEINRDGVSMAFALRYLEHWKEWVFLEYPEGNKSNIPPTGTCIEGIKVDFNTPGFKIQNLYCIVNSSGKKAPKTNVARSNIEVTANSELLTLTIYQLYFEHIISEVKNIMSSGFSISWAANETNFLLSSLMSNPRFGDKNIAHLESIPLFKKAISDVECVLIEENQNRKFVSVSQIISNKYFWTLDCEAYNSADSLIREAKSSNISALSIINSIYDKGESNTSHIDRLLCKMDSNLVIQRLIKENFHVSKINMIPEQRRLDLKWELKDKKIWEEIIIADDNKKTCYIQIEDIEISPSGNEIAIDSSKALFILKNSEINKFIIKTINSLTKKNQEDSIVLSYLIELIDRLFYYSDLDQENVEKFLENKFSNSNRRNLRNLFWERINKEELISVILKTKFIKYDTSIWYRRSNIHF